ncbi:MULTISPECIES: hypothetical protein [unclassified Streptomyces]|uniref:hypothetical protein n=1 Tax=unclassified Streptomyces TaxID=2593676 RepID=UPI001F0B84ED|nr:MULTISPECIES: hypothetical protein [unclassified Streptomyces]
MTVARRTAVLACGALWWWAVLRLLLAPDAGAPEAAVAAGGWGLSVLPVHCVPKAHAEGAVAARCWRSAWRWPGEGADRAMRDRVDDPSGQRAGAGPG